MGGALECSKSVWGLVTCVALLTACTHAGVSPAVEQGTSAGTSQVVPADGLKSVSLTAPVELRLKADRDHIEKVAYVHRSRSTSFEDVEVRKTTEEALDFVSQAETTNIDPALDRFTQSISITKKDGQLNLHDFAMPELGEKLEIVADGRGRILRAGDYPTNSIFYVPPISLPDGPVSVGDTWGLQARWLSLEELVPYQLDMTSILKNVWGCGAHRCAEIEISGEVTLVGALAQTMAFKSLWKGFLMFDIEAGTVLWSRVDSEEQFMSGNVRRSVSSCLEATLQEPVDLKLKRSQSPCQGLSGPGDIAPVPASVK